MNPYLNFNGNCREALDHYQQVLGAKLLFQHTWAESPMADQMPEGQGDAIMHATSPVPRWFVAHGSRLPADVFQTDAGLFLVGQRRIGR